VHDHREEWHTKIVAGKPTTPTPLLSTQMDNVLVNPSWHVPQSIIRNEYLPRYRHDPNIFARLGLEVKRNHDGTLSVTQPPGAGNALGRIKFNFPNKFSVYLHDTPQKQLFAADKRDLQPRLHAGGEPDDVRPSRSSSGDERPGARCASTTALFGRGERTLKLDQGPIVHLTYQTAFVDDAGKLQLREDVYLHGPAHPGHPTQ
jgi:murein L,D-transpeptidase YcbB/YkuD